MRKYVKIYDKKYDRFRVRCLLKLKTNTNNLKYIRITTKSNLHYSQFFPEKLILKRIDKEGNNFSQILEMRFSFIRSYRFMSFEHYLKLNQIFYIDPTLINQLNRDLPHPLINHYDYIAFNNS